jgi:hypothetical protein
MTEIIAGAGPMTGLGPEISGKIIFGLQPAGRKPMRFLTSGSCAGQVRQIAAGLAGLGAGPGDAPVWPPAPGCRLAGGAALVGSRRAHTAGIVSSDSGQELAAARTGSNDREGAS